MKSSPAAHRSRPWRVHALVPDFEVIDVWRFQLETPAASFPAFLDVFWKQMAISETWWLSRLRMRIGAVMGWDERPNTLPIPGCTETTVAERLPAAERAARDASPLPAVGVLPVYVRDDEALYEISNDTVHALLHLGPVEGGVELAVYIKSRGAFTRFYMAAIKPARHFVVYPALIRYVERAFRASLVSESPADPSGFPDASTG
jgi:hypothetical protein